MPSLEETIACGCWEDCPRKEQFQQMATDDITLEQVDALYRFLQGEVPDCLHLPHHPRLSPQMAFRVIYYLQEVMHLLPDRYERCITCGGLYDSENEGSSYKGLHCDGCRKD